MTVCIVVAEKHDIHADAILDKLRNHANVIRIDPTDPLPPLTFRHEAGFVSLGDAQFYLHDVSGIYCRYALEALSFQHIEDPVIKFSAEEHASAVIGVLLNVNSNRWINFPWHESIANGKIYPLLKAETFGLKIPKFIVSSDGSKLTDFAHENGDCIIKPLSDTPIAFQDRAFTSMPECGAFSAPYTADFIPSRLLESINEDVTPALVQKKIDKAFELRVVVIDRSVFASRLSTSGVSVVDSRLVTERSESSIYLESDLQIRLIDFVRSLGLRFAALDLLVDCNADVFLSDVNPAGNWLWQERDLGLPLIKAISEALLNGCRP